MKTNTPSADASSIRSQFPRESEEQHRKRFIEMVRNGDWKIREEIYEEPVCRLLKPRLSMSILFGRGKGYRRTGQSL